MQTAAKRLDPVKNELCQLKDFQALSSEPLSFLPDVRYVAMKINQRATHSSPFDQSFLQS